MRWATYWVQGWVNRGRKKSSSKSQYNHNPFLFTGRSRSAVRLGCGKTLWVGNGRKQNRTRRIGQALEGMTCRSRTATMGRLSALLLVNVELKQALNRGKKYSDLLCFQIYFLFFYEHWCSACLWICSPLINMPGAQGGRRWYQMLRNRHNRWLWAIMWSNPSLLEEQPILLSTEPFLKP